MKKNNYTIEKIKKIEKIQKMIKKKNNIKEFFE